VGRLQEYSPVFDAGRFAAQEKFFVEDARRWARSRFGVALAAERTAVFYGRPVRLGKEPSPKPTSSTS
jgi:hypothetical protein